MPISNQLWSVRPYHSTNQPFSWFWLPTAPRFSTPDRLFTHYWLLSLDVGRWTMVFSASSAVKCLCLGSKRSLLLTPFSVFLCDLCVSARVICFYLSPVRFTQLKSLRSPRVTGPYSLRSDRLGERPRVGTAFKPAPINHNEW